MPEVPPRCLGVDLAGPGGDESKEVAVFRDEGGNIRHVPVDEIKNQDGLGIWPMAICF